MINGYLLSFQLSTFNVTEKWSPGHLKIQHAALLPFVSGKAAVSVSFITF